MNKKDSAISFLRLASSGNVREAYNTYIHPDFRKKLQIRMGFFEISTIETCPFGTCSIPIFRIE